MVIAFSFIPTSWSCAKKLAPPSRAYLPASSVTPKAPTAPAEPVRTRAAKMPAHAAARSRMPTTRSATGGGRLTLRAREDASVRLRLRAPPISTLPVLGIVLAAGLLAVQYASQAREWAVMTDELQTSKLATSIAQTLSPVPQIHGEYYGALNQLYPLLLSPLYGSFSPPAAFDGAHVLNAFLLASSAWPAYLLGRAVSGSRAGGYFAAALTAFVPWLALSSTLLTENAAYPAFVWGLLLAYRALVEPSGRRDAAALAGLVLVYLARTQLFVLALALPIAVLVLERSLRRAVARHRVLAVAYGTAAGALGLSTDALVRWGGLLLAAALAAALWTLPSRATVAVLGIALTAYGAFEAGYVFDWFAVPATARPLRLQGVRPDLVDAAVPAGAAVALGPSPAPRAED